MDLIAGRMAYLKQPRQLLCAAPPHPPPRPSRSAPSGRGISSLWQEQIQDLCLNWSLWLVFGNKQVGPSPCLGLFLYREIQAATQDAIVSFQQLESSGGKQGGLTVGQTPPDCPRPRSCWFGGRP